ncbi:hypothetical protein [Agrobacterium burrii]
MLQLLRSRLIWLYKWLVTIIVWLVRNSFWWIELDPAEDALLRLAILRQSDDDDARAALHAVIHNLPDHLTEDYIVQELQRVFPAVDGADEARDDWICLLERLDAARKTAADQTRKNDIRMVMDLLFAFNRDKESALHHQLAHDGSGSLTETYIRQSHNYCRRQTRRFDTGVAWFPWGQKGQTFGPAEALVFYFCLVGIFMINCLTEAISYSFREYVGVARNGIQRPRSLYQVLVALFNRKNFNLADGAFLWEIGRQRTLGAVLSFSLFVTAYFHPSLYGQIAFTIGVGAGATIFQITIQLGDLVWFSIKCLNVAKELRPGLTWPAFIYAWFRGQIPNGTQQDREIYGELAKLNARSAAWAKTYVKSKSMSLLWIAYASKLSAPRRYYAARAGIFSKTVYDLAFFQKLIFPILTLGSGVLQAVALWGQWQTFTITMAFHVISLIKGLNLAGAPEQEVFSAANVWNNMIGPSVPTIFIVLVPSIAHKEFLSEPERLSFLMPITFFLSQFTDLISRGLTSGMKFLFARRS